MQQLVSTATEIYDREWQRKMDWTVKVPIWFAAAGVLVNLVLILMQAWS